MEVALYRGDDVLQMIVAMEELQRRKLASNLTSPEKRLGYRGAAVFWHDPKIQLRTVKANPETAKLEGRPGQAGSPDWSS